MSTRIFGNRLLSSILMRKRPLVGGALSDVELTPEFFERFWPLGGVKIGKTLQKHDNRMVLEILANEGRFVFKIADHFRGARAFERAVDIFEFLRDRGFAHAPKLLKLKDHTCYKEIQGTFSYIMEYVEGSPLGHTKENWRELGKTLAKLHSLSGYPHRSSYTVQAVMKELHQNARQLPFGQEYLKIVEMLPDFRGLSHSLLHTDVGPNNVIQKPNQDLVLIDWDDPGWGLTAIDLGFPLILHFVTYGSVFEQEKAASFYDAYFASRALSAGERAAIFDAGLLCALAYLPAGDTEKNWERVRFAVDNKELISTVLK